MNDLLFAGPDSLTKCSVRLTNQFWKETLAIFAKLTSKAINVKPQLFFHLNIFDNNSFKFGNNCIRKFDFPIVWSKRIQQVGDIFDYNIAPPKLLDRNELNLKFSLNLDFLRYHQLKTSILNMYQKITSSDHISGLLLPRLPLLFRIGNEQAKGCNFFYKILRSDNKIARMTLKSETKWQEKLNSNLSVKFWDKILKFPQKMLVPNKLIWTQIQINKYLLPTNYSVHHYDVNVSPLWVILLCPPRRVASFDMGLWSGTAILGNGCKFDHKLLSNIYFGGKRSYFWC